MNGKYYYPGTSKYSSVLIEDSKDQVIVYSGNDDIIEDSPKKNLEINQNISGLPVTIYFPSGGKFVADDESADLSKDSKSFISTIEKNKYFLSFGIFLIPIMIYIFSTVIFPYTSMKIAETIPYKMKQMITAQFLKTNDSLLKNQSNLTDKRKLNITKMFHQAIIQLNLKMENYNLIFISSDESGANAFALPDGTIMLTDDLVNLYEGDDELLLSVLLHEVGHVENNHGLTLVIRSIGTVVILNYIIGDITALSDFIITSSAIFLQLSFSREMESDADYYSLSKLIEINKDPKLIALALEKLSIYTKDEEGIVPSYLSSHPITKDRISFINNAIK